MQHWPTNDFLPRDALHSAAQLCYGVVSVCPFVCPSVTFLYSVERTRSKHILKLFLSFGSSANFQFFRTKYYGEIPTGSPLDKGVMSYAGWLWKNRDFRVRPISRFILEKIHDRAIDFKGVISNKFEWPWLTWWNVQQHNTERRAVSLRQLSFLFNGGSATKGKARLERRRGGVEFLGGGQHVLPFHQIWGLGSAVSSPSGVRSHDLMKVLVVFYCNYLVPIFYR